MTENKVALKNMTEEELKEKTDQLARYHRISKYIYNNYTYKLKRNKNQYVPHFFRCLR